MPEGHVIHRLARELTAAFGGREVRVSSPQGRFASEADRLDGSGFVVGEACGKHLFLSFDVPEPSGVHIHLGLIGKLRIRDLAEPVGVVRLRIADGAVAADLHGPQWCRAVTLEQWAGVMAASGPDPLRPDADPERGWAKIRRSAKPIAALLMDQKIAAGVGNIYRAEVLFRHRVDPMAPGDGLRRATWQAMWDDLAVLMADGVETGRIDTLLPEHMPEATGRAARDDPHGGEVYVYRRAGQPCLICGTAVQSSSLAGRNLYWCPRCQRRKR
ncbi:MAG: zinc finger domain-containing protein [Propionibacteriaceae bacterium]|nr:zinc finger domain-containing protein [Propionibacteriaceae bacterium]